MNVSKCGTGAYQEEANLRGRAREAVEYAGLQALRWVGACTAGTCMGEPRVNL